MVQKTTQLAISLVLAACAGPLAYKVHKTVLAVIWYQVCYVVTLLL